MKLFKAKISDEASLIKACLKRNAKAERMLYDRFAPKMLAVCMRYIGSQYEAEEVLMSGFVKVYDKLSTFQQEGSFEGWIRRIMINESLMYIRKHKKRLLEDDIQEMEMPSLSEDVLDELSAQELLQMVSQLPNGYRSVFNLYVVEGFSHKEIAQKLGITEGSSKSQLSKARVALRKLLEKNNFVNV